MAYDKIVTLRTFGYPSDRNFDVLFRVDLPAGRKHYQANPTAATAYPDEADLSLNDALKAGTTVEIRESIFFRRDVANPEVQAVMEKRYSILTSEQANSDPLTDYGMAWDGKQWRTV